MNPAFNTTKLINPYNHQPLKYSLEEENLVDVEGNVIPVVNGIPNFLSLETTNGLNKKYKGFYDRIGGIIDFAELMYSIFVDVHKIRSEWLADVDVKPGFKVLETSVGTGWNFKVLPQNAEFYGLDISNEMLKNCQRNSERWNIPIHLFQGNAEYLPFMDESFDSVFHFGGINFFNDRERAVREMVRVAKPGTKIVIIDETEKRVLEQYRKTPHANKFFTPVDLDKHRLSAPVNLVPPGMKEIEVKFPDFGKMYQLSFRKPYKSDEKVEQYRVNDQDRNNNSLQATL